jgi:hypothetical protein
VANFCLPVTRDGRFLRLGEEWSEADILRLAEHASCAKPVGVAITVATGVALVALGFRHFPVSLQLPSDPRFAFGFLVDEIVRSTLASSSSRTFTSDSAFGDCGRAFQG